MDDNSSAGSIFPFNPPSSLLLREGHEPLLPSSANFPTNHGHLFGDEISRFSGSLAGPSSQVFPFSQAESSSFIFNLAVQQEANLAGGDHGDQIQQAAFVSPPTMHPNLVTTLKSILSPPRSPIEGKSGADYLANEREIGDSAVFSESPNASLAANQADNKEGDEGDDQMLATVVSVDLIRNRRPFTCSYEGCNKTFKNPQTMKMHYKTHYPGTEVCKLRRNSLLSMPASSSKAGHNKKIPSRCPVCRKTFVGLYELRRHFGRKHSEGEKMHACKKCGKRFYIEVDLRDHEKLCGEPIRCKCGMKFAFKCNLVAHKKAHPECQDISVNVAANHRDVNTNHPLKDASNHAFKTSILASKAAIDQHQHLPPSSSMMMPPLASAQFYDARLEAFNNNNSTRSDQPLIIKSESHSKSCASSSHAGAFLPKPF